ncbi:MAG: CBS domain-containing protein, partial [Candidatus Thermoplasmatota archaeon]
GLKDLTELFARPKERMGSRGRAAEKDPVKVLVGSIMRPPVTVAPGLALPKALAMMRDKGISTLMIVEDGEPTGIVTNADLVELAARFREREGLFVQISGLEEQPDVYDQMYDMIQKAMKRISGLVTPRMLNVHVVQYKADGDNSKWSVRARFTTEHQMYYVKHFDWELFKTLDALLDQLEQQIKKAKDRKVTDRKRRHAS